MRKRVVTFVVLFALALVVGAKVAEWTRKAKSGRNAYTLLLAPKARRKGRDTLRITASGRSMATIVAVVLRA